MTYCKLQTVIKLIKGWRNMQELGNVVYPEVIDSVLLILMKKMAI